MREHLHMLSRRQPIFIADRMFQVPTQLLSKVLKIANIRAIILIKQDYHDTNQEISNDENEDRGESTSSSDIEEDDLDNQQKVLHEDQVRCDKTIRTTRVPLSKKRSCADTVISHTPLPNLQHPVGAIALPLLKHRKSTIDISQKSDVV